MVHEPVIPRPRRRSPLALLAGSREWPLRSIESVLEAAGIEALRARSARDAIERYRAARPDIVLLDAELPDLDGITACRLLRSDQGDASTPVLIWSTEAWSRSARVEALRAGAWGVLAMPLDAEELTLRVRLLAEAKLEADRSAAAGLVEESTGLYNAHGMFRRLVETISEGARHGRALACLVVAVRRDDARGDATGAGIGTLPDALARSLRRAIRGYDAIGRVGPDEFIVVSPGAGRDAARVIAERLAGLAEAAIAGAGGEAGPATVRVGCYVLEDVARESATPVMVLGRATTALRRAQAGPRGERVRFYDPADGE